MEKLNKKWIRKIVCAAMSVMLCLCFAACQKGGGGAESNTVSMYDLQTTMLAADDTLPDMTSVNSSSDDAEGLFSYLSDYDYSKVDGYFLAYSSEGLADEVAVVRMKNSADVKDMEASLKKHAEGRVSLYKSYQPDQVDRAENALIFTKGNYAVLVISEKQKDIQAAFEKAISGN